MALPVLNYLHMPAESKEKYIPASPNPALVLLERQKIASPSLFTSHFSLESRENRFAELLFCSCLCIHDQKGHEEAGTRKTLISAFSSLCLFAPCCPAKGVVLLCKGPKPSSLLPEAMGIREEHPECQGTTTPCNGTVCRGSRGKAK